MAKEKSGEFDQIKYQNEYNKKNYDRQGLIMPKGKKELIREASRLAGQSMNEYINQAIDERMAREGSREC